MEIANKLYYEKDTTVPNNAEPPDIKSVITWDDKVDEWVRPAGRTTKKHVGHYIKIRKEQYLVWVEKDKLKIIKEGKGESKRKVVLTQANAEILFNFFIKRL